MRDFYFDLLAAPRRLLWLRSLLLLLGALALAAVVGYRYGVLSPELAAQRGQIQAEAAKLGMPAPTSSQKPAELAQAWQRARSVSVQLGLPWQRFFVALGEASKDGNVALISIEPDPLKAQVVLVAEARNMDAMLDFVSALQASPDFNEVVLQSHNINKAVPENPVRFRLAAGWRIAE